MPTSEKGRNTRDLCRRQSPLSLVFSTNPATWCKWRLGITGRKISVWRDLSTGLGVKHIYFCASFFPERIWVFVILPLSIAAEKKEVLPLYLLLCLHLLLLASEIRWELLFIVLVWLAGVRPCVGYSQWVSNLFNYWFYLRESFFY